jgi:hypothetical protein
MIRVMSNIHRRIRDEGAAAIVSGDRSVGKLQRPMRKREEEEAAQREAQFTPHQTLVSMRPDSPTPSSSSNQPWRRPHSRLPLPLATNHDGRRRGQEIWRRGATSPVGSGNRTARPAAAGPGRARRPFPARRRRRRRRRRRLWCSSASSSST